MKNIFLDSTGVYKDYDIDRYNAIRLDISDLAGTDMYCSEESAGVINDILVKYGWRGIHFIDSGNYHYMTKLFTDMAQQPFSLVLFDNHTDMQAPLFEGILSCGGWARDVLLRNSFLRQLVLIGPDDTTMEDVDIENGAVLSKLIRIFRDDMHKKDLPELFRQVSSEYPIYISIDKDVLEPAYAVTNWNQGEMSGGTLTYVLTWLVNKFDVIGADICGEYSARSLLVQPEDPEQIINRSMNRSIYDVLSSGMC